jgi:hypothetical protein
LVDNVDKAFGATAHESVGVLLDHSNERGGAWSNIKSNLFVHLFILLLKGLSCYTMDLRTRSGHVPGFLDVRGFGELRVRYTINTLSRLAAAVITYSGNHPRAWF